MRTVDIWASSCQWGRLKSISVDVMTHRRYGYHKMLVTGHSKKVRYKHHRAKSRHTQMIEARKQRVRTLSDLKP